MTTPQNIPESPPLPIKQVIEKSVSYVLKNGTSFEEKLRQNDANGQFAFLAPENPHYAYYKYRLAAESSQKQNGNGSASPKDGPSASKLEKPRELLFLTEVPPISNHDMEVIKATALYVACNSSANMEAFHRYMGRKGRRNQFAFVNKSHTLHGLFQTYIKQYKAIIDKTQGNANDSTTLIDSYIAEDDFLQRAYDRAAFEKRHKIKEKTKEQDVKNRQIRYASIDWQDFAFVSKINFDAIDEVSELPVPMSRESVVYRSLEAKTQDLELDVAAAQTHEKRESGDQNGPETSATPKAPSNVPKGMKIRAAGESRLKRKANETTKNGTIRCPITGVLVPETEFDTHLKTLLRDPRYKEQQENFMRKNFTYASNLTTDQVYDNIKRLVKKRGQSEEEEAAEGGDVKRINIEA